MLFTPSPPLSAQSVSSSVESDLSPTHTTSICKARNVENQLQTISLSNNPILSTNGPSNNPVLSTIQSSFPQLSDQDFYQSPLSQTPRRGSYPDSLIRDMLMATLPTPDSHMYHTEAKTHFPKANLWSNNDIMPIANPVAAAALVEDNEIVINEEQLTKSVNSSPLDTPKNSENIDRTPTVCSTNNFYPSVIHANRKAILNVGGVKHEGNLLIYLLFF
jgi:hypothetical protein